MNSLNDLRDSLDRHAGPAPDTVGLIEQAQTGAARIRRRRRSAGAGVCAAAVVLAVAAVPAILPLRQPGLPVAAPADARTSTQYTLGVATGSTVTLHNLRSSDNRQNAYATIRPAGSGGKPFLLDHPFILVSVYDPGAFDPTTLRLGALTTVRGHRAWLAADYLDEPSDPRSSATTVLGWQDPSGAWVTVGSMGTHSPGSHPVDDKTRTALTTVAEAVRIGPVRDLAMPYRLGWLPPGVRVDSVQPRPEAHVRLDGTRTAAPTGSGKPAVVSLPVTIVTVTATRGYWKERRGSDYGARTTVAGHPAWYRPLGKSTEPSTLAVEVGNCGFIIYVWRGGISFAEQERMVAAMTVVDCAKPATWIPLLR